MSEPLSALIDNAIRQSLAKRTAISFSGGLDSSTIATITKKYCQVELFCAGVARSPDFEYAQKVAGELSLPLFKILVDEKTALEAYKKVHSLLPLDRLKIEILIPVYLVAEAAAKRKHSVILFGAAAEELFVGYARYFLYQKEGKDLESILKYEYKNLPKNELAWVSTICTEFGLSARAPFYNCELADRMFSIPLSERMADHELRKILLRNAARDLGVPELAVMRKKKAMQYGSGVHKLISKHKPEFKSSMIKTCV